MSNQTPGMGLGLGDHWKMCLWSIHREWKSCTSWLISEWDSETPSLLYLAFLKNFNKVDWVWAGSWSCFSVSPSPACLSSINSVFPQLCPLQLLFQWVSLRHIAFPYLTSSIWIIQSTLKGTLVNTSIHLSGAMDRGGQLSEPSCKGLTAALFLTHTVAWVLRVHVTLRAQLVCSRSRHGPGFITSAALTFSLLIIVWYHFFFQLNYCSNLLSNKILKRLKSRGMIHVLQQRPKFKKKNTLSENSFE